MIMPVSNVSCDVRPLKSLQGGATSGHRRGPAKATGGHSRPSRHAGGRQSNATGRHRKEQQLKVMHWNAEGVMNKKTELENLLFKEEVSVCCIQETHLTPEKTFRVRGYQSFRSDRENRHKGGILTLVRNNISACQRKVFMEGAEYQVMWVKLKDTELHILNYYCPNDRPLSLNTIGIPETQFLAVGDFNSHSQSWGYNHLDSRGEEVEDWQDDNKLALINRPYDSPTFYSRRWKNTSTPDLAFATDDVHKETQRVVGEQLGGSDHKPVILSISHNLEESFHAPRWNYKKAKWGLYKHRTNILTQDLRVEGRDINNVVLDLNRQILQAAHECIPRGARKDYKPYWTSDLQDLETKLNNARSLAESQPSDEHQIKLQEAKAKFLRTKIQAKRQSWRSKTASLNMEKDGRKLWRLVGAINDDRSHSHNITLEKDGRILTGKLAANTFADNYEVESNIKVTPTQQREARKELREARHTTNRVMRDAITLQELQKALKRLKPRKSPGPDNITNEMLQNLGNTALIKLLQVFNLSWETGTVPQTWREAIMIPILKKGKDKKKAASYRPISLTSCVVKTLERIINLRLLHHLETEQLIVPEQAGFRRFFSTEDQVTYLSQEIEDAFQEQKVVVAAWIDLQKAFDKVWKDGLLVKLQRNGISSQMNAWIRSYLHNRRARVHVNGWRGKDFLLRHGVPQGGVLSPTLFLIFINDLIKDLPKGVHAALYADDLVMWSKEEHATTASYRIQLAANKLTEWADRWNVTINKEKSSTTLFSLSPKQKSMPIKLGDTTLACEDEATYLGVTFDKRLTWKPHLSKAEDKARKKLAIMRKLAGTTWGASDKVLKHVYQGTVRPHLEYGSTAWSTAAKTHQQSLDKVQNQALRIITGSMKSTPITAMQELTAIQPLKDRRDAKNLIQGEKIKCLPNHPMAERIGQPVKGRLKRTSFLHEVKKLSRAHPVSSIATAPIDRAAMPQPWVERPTNISIRPEVPHITQREDHNDLIKRTHALSLLDEMYPADAWIHVYTDGSATNAVRNGGAGVLVCTPEGERQKYGIATGKHCTNYAAEIQALSHGAEKVRASKSECNQVVFLTDARSVLDALAEDKLPHLSAKLQALSTFQRISLQWIPAHCGIPGNEAADRLAKEGARAPQEENQVTYDEKKTLIKAAFRPAPTTEDAYHKLDRWQQAIIFRLRTGHCRLKAHLYKKFRLVPSPLCTCGEEETPEHVIQNCPLYDRMRSRAWPTRADLHTKLHGSKQDLLTTTSFIKQTGLAI